jgi:hypothetical protein
MVLPAMRSIVRRRFLLFCTVRDGLAELDLLGCGRALTMRVEDCAAHAVLILRSPPQAGVSKDASGKHFPVHDAFLILKLLR